MILTGAERDLQPVRQMVTVWIRLSLATGYGVAKGCAGGGGGA